MEKQVVWEVELTSTEDNDASFAGSSLDGLIVDGSDVAHYINDQAWALVAVEVQHVSQGPIRDCRTEDGDVVAGCPVAHRCLIVDLLPKTSNHLEKPPTIACF